MLADFSHFWFIMVKTCAIDYFDNRIFLTLILDVNVVKISTVQYVHFCCNNFLLVLYSLHNEKIQELLNVRRM